MTTSRRKACSWCIKAKRRCDLRLPQCRRCFVKGLDCRYGPRAEPEEHPGTDFLFANSELAFDFSSLNGLMPTDVPALNETDQLSRVFEPTLQDTSGPIQGDSTVTSAMLDYDSHTALSLSESSHQEDPPLPGGCFDAAVLHLYVDELKRWLLQWVTKGTNPFIHPQLYYDYIPSEILDAYSCCSIYSTKSAGNQRIVFRIIEEKVTALLNTHHLHLHQQQQQQEQQTSNFTPSHLTLRRHLAHVQSLLIYQIIRLFGGDIRQQALAEQQAPILTTWLQEMWDSLMNSGLDIYYSDSNGTSSPSSSLFAASGQPQKQQPQRDPLSLFSTPVTSLWKEWLVAECARRTLITVRGVAGVYETMKLGAAVCPGGTSFIASSAVWEAPSAYCWAKAWRERDKRYLVSMGTLQSLVCQARACDVDRFGKVLLMLLHHREGVERWIAETGGGEGVFGLALDI
ncbi:conserved hypothetical protein [Histoplasma capsulatum var. duboisii H88]|uniref:Zn(2)-C6 fungal-type domain-containing protein n=1 Tax=Ajellomyces capsulatus (strain H88) TaxID=544711 RepID=F0UTT5_AJEC8|nr:conserved hypothetical protein [Histoplasma capsulatum var. duboisii H88]